MHCNLLYSPVIKEGIPLLKPWSKDWLKYWSQQYLYCKNGYKPPGGVQIPGPYYQHLNFWPINRLRYPGIDPKDISPTIDAFPLYRELDHRIFDILERKRRGEKGNVNIKKGRRKGVTEDIISFMAHVIMYEQSARCGIGVPTDETYQNTIPIFKQGWNGLPTPMFQDFSRKNRKEFEVGFETMTEEGEKKEGIMSQLQTKVFTHSGVFKGSKKRVLLIDEDGLFTKKPSLIECLGDTIDCVKEGEVWTGFMILVGTSDQVNFDNPDTQTIWNNPALFDFENLFIPGDECYTPFVDFITGKSDRKGATEAIMARRKQLEQANDKTALIKFIQNQPLNEGELFLVGTDNDIDVPRINSQITQIAISPELKNKSVAGDMEWVEAEKEGKRYYTGEVMFIPRRGGDYIQSLQPINDKYMDADIMAVDDVYKDEAPESDSKPAAVVYRRFVSGDKVCRVPVMTWMPNVRPKKRSISHEAMLKMAVYHRCRAAVELNEMGMRDFFIASKIVDGRRYLKRYPKVSGKVVNERDAYGYNIKEAEKAGIYTRMKEWVDSEALRNTTDVRFLKQIAIFGKKNSDIGSAFGICLLYEEDLMQVPVKSIVPKGQEEEIGFNAFSLNSATGRLETTGKIGNSKLNEMLPWMSKM